jgi:curved DNA-binding protein CbpA
VVSVPDPYKVLQIDPSAEIDVIEAAYKRLAKKYHPDVAPDPEARERMVQLNLARDVLRDPVRRAALDRARTRAAATSARVVADQGRWRASTSSPAGTSAPRTEAGPPPRPQARDQGGARGPGWTFPGVAEPDPSFGERMSTSWTAEKAAGGGQHEPTSTVGGQRYGEAGEPPGNPSGSILTFGRYSGWSLGEVARVDLEYLEWLERMPVGRMYGAEIDLLLRQHGRRTARFDAADTRHGLFRRR